MTVAIGGGESAAGWNGCGETAGFSTFSHGQSTRHYADSRLTRQEVDLQGAGYGGGESGDEATDVLAVPKGYWEAGVGVGNWGQVPPATEN